jgi:thiol-disulfide isomerase/thioredoxin
MKHVKHWLAMLALSLLAAHAAASQLRDVTPRPAPSLLLTQLDGDRVDLDQMRGRVVLVNFWAVWCPPCRKEMPSMARLADRLAGQPFTILGVNVGESPEEIRAFLRQVPVNFPILLDQEARSLKPWNVFAFPTTYVVDKRGRVRLGLFGSIEWDDPEAVARVEALLAEPD